LPHHSLGVFRLGRPAATLLCRALARIEDQEEDVAGSFHSETVGFPDVEPLASQEVWKGRSAKVSRSRSAKISRARDDR
jgi:hypothetical protein